MARKPIVFDLAVEDKDEVNPLDVLEVTDEAALQGSGGKMSKQQRRKANKAAKGGPFPKSKYAAPAPKAAAPKSTPKAKAVVSDDEDAPALMMAPAASNEDLKDKLASRAKAHEVSQQIAKRKETLQTSKLQSVTQKIQERKKLEET